MILLEIHLMRTYKRKDHFSFKIGKNQPRKCMVLTLIQAQEREVRNKSSLKSIILYPKNIVKARLFPIGKND